MRILLLGSGGRENALAWKLSQSVWTNPLFIAPGNPGTAKTTVARLYAQIMKENGLIERGQIVELGRGDLVGKYVGWTAPTVKKRFKDRFIHFFTL